MKEEEKRVVSRVLSLHNPSFLLQTLSLSPKRTSSFFLPLYFSHTQASPFSLNYPLSLSYERTQTSSISLSLSLSFPDSLSLSLSLAKGSDERSTVMGSFGLFSCSRFVLGNVYFRLFLVSRAFMRAIEQKQFRREIISKLLKGETKWF